LVLVAQALAMVLMVILGAIVYLAQLPPLAVVVLVVIEKPMVQHRGVQAVVVEVIIHLLALLERQGKATLVLLEGVYPRAAAVAVQVRQVLLKMAELVLLLASMELALFVLVAVAVQHLERAVMAAGRRELHLQTLLRHQVQQILVAVGVVLMDHQVFQVRAARVLSSFVILVHSAAQAAQSPHQAVIPSIHSLLLGHTQHEQH
jgi:hypothetical protein